MNYINNIDVIYWLNLDKSVNRKKEMEILLSDSVFDGIPKIRINAIDGNDDNFKKMFNYDDFINHQINANEYGCLLSHLEAIKTFANRGDDDEIALIFEDDVSLDFKKYWSVDIKTIMNEAPQDWDIIQLCYITQNYNIPKNNFESYKSSTSAYIIKKKSAIKMINNCFIDNKYKLDSKIDPVADVYLYEVNKTYLYKYPLFIYKSNNDSTIHPDHLDDHEKSKKLIIEHIYGNFINVDEHFGLINKKNNIDVFNLVIIFLLVIYIIVLIYTYYK
jgi:GR25 family glycosyltransferase involved in LPS biosynthesis